MIELPTEADYHTTSLIEVVESHHYQKKEDTIYYKKCLINLRSVVDISEKTIMVNVIDEEKYPEYQIRLEKHKVKVEEFKKSMQEKRVKEHEQMGIVDEATFQTPMLFGVPSMEEAPPHKEVKVVGILVLYFNGAQRFIVDDFQEFEEMYFKYLKFQKMDM